MDTLIELKAFYEKMVQYKKLVREWAHVFIASEAIVEKIQSLRTELQRTYSRLEKDIASYGGKSSISVGIFGREENVFEVAFDTLDIFNSTNRLDAVDKAMQIVNKAIGKLEAEKDSWRVEGDNESQKKSQPSKKAVKTVKAFIAHGGDSPALRKLKAFLESLDVQPLVVEEQPSEGRSVGEKVDWYSKQADCAIILATKGDIDVRTGGFIPRGNVLMEIGKLQELFGNKIVYLLQSGTKFPTNVSEKVWTQFSPQSMDNAFITVARELRAFGILEK